jgi:hypothetical protein
MPGMYVTSLFVALVLLAQTFRIVISRIKLHNSLRVYRRKAIADGVCGSYDHILSASLRQITQPWWNKVDSRLPVKAYREAIRAMVNRRQVESSR